MKANKAPEKIYMTPSFGEPDNVLAASFSKSHLDFHRDIEYTRTDAFIEKACEWFRKIDYDDSIPPFETTEEFIEGFKKAMML